jgi:cytochrome d ubiquinol oxidase subunit I
MQTQDAVSPAVSTGMVLASLVAFTLLYAALMAADVYLLRKFARRGLTEVEGESWHVEPEASGGTFSSAGTGQG